MENNQTTGGNPITWKECTCGKKNEQVDACERCKVPAGMVGWICPVCGRGNSPFSSSCPCKPFPQYNITCQTQQ